MRLFEGTEFDIPPKCDRCGLLESDCECLPEEVTKELLPPEKQTASVRTEKRKNGKIVTVISGLCVDGNDLPALLKDMKNRCGAGGAIKNDAIEIQGEHVERLCDALKDIGYKVKST